MSIEYKTFTVRFASSEDSIMELRKEFPGCYFTEGSYAGEKGVFAHNTEMPTREYNERKIYKANGDIFFGPADIQAARAALSSFKTAGRLRANVPLMCGETLEIYPASAIPKAELFGFDFGDDNKSTDEVYNTDHQYGQLAYKLYSQLRENDNIQDIELSKQLQAAALLASYTFPLEVWAYLGIIDIEEHAIISVAAMGFDDAVLKQIASEYRAQ